MRKSEKCRYVFVGTMLAFALCAAEPALCQQDNSQSGGSQMPPSQGGATASSPGTPLQPSEIEEQQIEQQQQSQQQTQPPG
jgi:hypothetical protein